MLIIDTILKETKLKGIGLFANQNIKKWQIIWKDNNHAYTFSKFDYSKMNSIQKAFVDKYSIPKDSKYILDLDNTRFMNHSENPNILFLEDHGIATKNIKIGEELTCNYDELSSENKNEGLGFENLE